MSADSARTGQLLAASVSISQRTWAAEEASEAWAAEGWAAAAAAEGWAAAAAAEDAAAGVACRYFGSDFIFRAMSGLTREVNRFGFRGF